MRRPVQTGKRGAAGSAPQVSGAAREAYAAIIELYRRQDFRTALTRTEELLATAPRFGDAWNVKGVLLNNLGRYKEAIDAFEEARRTGANTEAVLVNLAKSHLALGDTAKSAEAARAAIRLNPKGLDGALSLARARHRASDANGALQALQPALLSHPTSAPLRELRANILRSVGRYEEALKDFDIAVKSQPTVSGRLDRGWLLLTMGRKEEGQQALEAAVRDHPNDATALRSMADFYFREKEDREAANDFYRRSLAARFDVEAAGHLVFSLMATRGAKEAANVEEAHQLTARIIDAGQFDMRASVNLVSMLSHVADFKRLAKIDRWKCGEYWARTNSPGGLHGLLSRVETAEDRRHLLDLHRLWGNIQAERAATLAPLPALVAHKPRGKIRVGIMSSDLRHHPVTYFALPLFDHFDPERFEIYCYSFYPREPDQVQRYIMSKATQFRTIVGGADRDVARQMMADELDIVFELGGSTHLNRINVLAYRVAPVQASWLGYPNSAGLPTIDRILVDPYIRNNPELLVEKPFNMPHSWVCLSRLGFHDGLEIRPDPPLVRNGYITFGTANNPMKYTPALIRLWARVLSEVPQSRFLLIRPEGDVPAFRGHILDEFAAGGVPADRVDFRPVRGQHMPHYNDIDIALDCGPQTGGTTTCETMWMGVPVVTKVGEAFYERLSYSNISNAGLGDLCAADDDGYVRTAVALAADTKRIIDLRRSLRGTIRTATPLGDTKGWVDAWQNEIERIVKGGA